MQVVITSFVHLELDGDLWKRVAQGTGAAGPHPSPACRVLTVPSWHWDSAANLQTTPRSQSWPTATSAGALAMPPEAPAGPLHLPLGRTAVLERWVCMTVGFS